MRNSFQDYGKKKVEENRIRAAYHEAAHIVIAEQLEQGIHIDAWIDDDGNGWSHPMFSPNTQRDAMFDVGTAGFLGEAKGVYGELSTDQAHTRAMAVQVHRHLRGEDPVGPRGEFQVDVFLKDGSQKPAGTNMDDFHFVLSEMKNRVVSFASHFWLTNLVNDIQNGIGDCLQRFGQEDVWQDVAAKAKKLKDDGRLSC